VLQSPSIVKVFVNGNWFGIYGDADSLIKDIRHMRRSYTIPKEVSVIRDIANREIRLLTDSGRVQRPLFIVENNKLKI
jgi:DNA-directed RNA polymerase II subunit RPB2